MSDSPMGIRGLAWVGSLCERKHRIMAIVGHRLMDGNLYRHGFPAAAIKSMAVSIKPDSTRLDSTPTPPPFAMESGVLGFGRKTDPFCTDLF